MSLNTSMDPERKKNLLALLHGGEYSDFTIKCDGRVWTAHRAIVCPASKVFKVALQPHWKEGMTETITSEDFDGVTMDHLLTYIYTGDYSPLSDETDDTSTEQFADSTHTQDDSSTVQYTSAQVEHCSAMIAHIKVVEIANFYAVLPLASLAAAQFKSLLQDKVAACDINVAKTVWQSTSLDCSMRMQWAKIVGKLVSTQDPRAVRLLAELRKTDDEYHPIFDLVQASGQHSISERIALKRSNHEMHQEIRALKQALSSARESQVKAVAAKELLILNLKNKPLKCSNPRCHLKQVKLAFDERRRGPWRPRCAHCRRLIR